MTDSCCASFIKLGLPNTFQIRKVTFSCLVRLQIMACDVKISEELLIIIIYYSIEISREGEKAQKRGKMQSVVKYVYEFLE